MSAHEKLEFFAPIWRIMRDENMTVEQVPFFPEIRLEDFMLVGHRLVCVGRCMQMHNDSSVAFCVQRTGVAARLTRWCLQ